VEQSLLESIDDAFTTYELLVLGEGYEESADLRLGGD
jgi:hypothetical protein